jgi:aromatic ring hydroxylase
MKKAMTILGAILFVSATSTSCVKMASDYDNILREYKKMLCVLMDENNNSMSDKTKSLQRQQELNKEFQEAMKKLSQDEKSNLLRSWANALVEVGEGKCD